MTSSERVPIFVELCLINGVQAERLTSTRQTIQARQIAINTMQFMQFLHSNHFKKNNFEIESRTGSQAIRWIAATAFSALAILLSSFSINGFAQPELTKSQMLSLQQEPKPVVKEEPTTRKETGGFLGAYLGDLNEERARELSLPEVSGALVGKVEEGSPGDKSGLKADDVIVSFNEQKIQNRSQVNRLLVESYPGSKAAMGVIRNGSLKKLTVILGRRNSRFVDDRKGLFSEADAFLATAEQRHQEAEELRKKGDEKGAAQLLEEEKEFRKQSEDRRTYVEEQLREGKIQESPNSRRMLMSAETNRYNLGLTLVELSKQLAKFFNAPDGGLLVTEVRAGEGAEKFGIKAGDCLVSINGEKVVTQTDFNRLTARSAKEEKESGEFLLGIVRDRVLQSVKISIDQR